MSKVMIIHSNGNGELPKEKKANIEQKYKDELVEVGLYSFREGSGLSIEPTKSDGSIKTYILLEGVCYNPKTDAILRAGDMVVMKDDTENYDLLVREDARILVHAYQEDVISEVDENVRNQIEILERIQEKDHYTDSHCISVRYLANEMGLRMGYKGQRFHDFMRAARSHDIGKIYIRDSILLKPGPLNEEEYAEMKEHVNLGKELITGRHREQVFRIISEHHERIDGSGYPKGLVGEEISEEGRLMAICDSYDAMTTDRIYKKAKTHEEAVAELRSLAGTKYDARLVEEFIEMLEKKSAEY